MRPPYEESGPTTEATFQTSATTPNRPKSTRSAPPQKERVRRMLTGRWVCGTEFLNPTDGHPPILRYSSRFTDLKRDGWYLARRVCENRLHDHRYSTMYQWTITGHVDDGKLPLGAAE